MAVFILFSFNRLLLQGVCCRLDTRLTQGSTFDTSAHAHITENTFPVQRVNLNTAYDRKGGMEGWMIATCHSNLNPKPPSRRRASTNKLLASFGTKNKSTEAFMLWVMQDIMKRAEEKAHVAGTSHSTRRKTTHEFISADLYKAAVP